ncbi:hypothetical protein C8Q77DRAFT_28087 [Trametes polyzona]|nr:hypothetical protein C8Q77DRAFT_28087 [Trametes polyzona]
MALLSRDTEHEIRRAHVKQLACFSVGSPCDDPTVPDKPGDSPPPPPDELLPVILGWISDNPRSIAAAKKARCNSGTAAKSPDWDVVLLTLIESVTMYLRKPEDANKAVLAAREGDIDGAIAHLQASEELIHVVAKALDCTFIQLCDFADKSPDGLPVSGAFCGLFVYNQEGPFMGVAFKGSNRTDIWTDIAFLPIPPPRPEIVWGALIHGGFYINLFGEFTVEDKVQVPFDVLSNQLSNAYVDGALLHATGHSLGGALCTLAYGEFLRRREASELPFLNFNFGDLYSFAAPRTCYEPYAAEFRKVALGALGRNAFRIANRHDPIPTLPPPGPPLDECFPTSDFPFVHIAGGWEIGEDGGPQPIADEPPSVPPMSLGDFTTYGVYHDTRRYYASWQTTPHTKA